MGIWIEADKCDGCRRCIRACPYEAIALDEGIACINSRCTLCGACIEACPNQAVCSDIEPRIVPDFSGWQGVWVVAEHHDNTLARVTLELLGKAVDLAKALNQSVAAVLIGSHVEPLADTLAAHGAQKVYLVQHERFKDYETINYADVIEHLVEQGKPSILLLGATRQGRDLAPRVSRRLKAGLTADCTELSIHPEEKILLQTRPAFGGNVMATIANRYSRPQMATVRPGVMNAVPGQTDHQAEIIRGEAPPQSVADGLRVLKRVRDKQPGRDIIDTPVIVAGGRGVNGTRGFDMLRQLADLLGGEVAGTRIAVEEGWIPQENQVGQTGKTVQPELYIACGISGAVQHKAGMVGSRYIVAINKDSDAPIFAVANWGIVGDVNDIVPELIRQLS